jgi:Protein phosphatase 2C
MRLSAETFWAEKAGNSPAEYEDAFYPPDSLIDEQRATFSFAVADGATDTCYSGIWARQLVSAYCEGVFNPTDFVRSLRKLEEDWRAEVLGKGSLPWYLEQKIEDGAFATLTGLTLESSSEGAVTEGTWHAIAVGDSCLFQLRGGNVLASFPIGDAMSFTNSPVLLSSRSDRNRSALTKVLRTSGVWQAGDSFYLMTDALSCWFLQQRRVPWRQLQDVDRGRHSFRRWIDKLRARKLMKNDDVTLVRIEIPQPWDS